MSFDLTALRAAEKALTGAPQSAPSGLDGLARILAGAESEPAPPPTPVHKLGSLSEHYESGGRGPGTVSAGLRDPGGVSYGLYQLATRTGTVAAFVSSEGVRWSRDFLGKAPGTPAFAAAWQAVAAREPEAFGTAQHAFIERTHYRPLVGAVMLQTGLDPDQQANAVRDACWSCAVQHGGAARIVTRAVAAADKVCPRTYPAYDRALIEAIYAERIAYVRKLAESADRGARRTMLDLASKRYPSERAAALAML
jgi:hypothetical protein